MINYKTDRYNSTLCSGGINIFDIKTNKTKLITIDSGIDQLTQERKIKPIKFCTDYKRMNYLERLSILDLFRIEKIDYKF